MTRSEASRSRPVRTSLPIDALIPSVIEAVRSNPITLLQAEPGAGKTTRVPPALLEAGFRKVIVLEPRRLANELGESLGETVGFQVRFEQQGSAQTRLWFVTEGVLTRRLAEQRNLPDVDVVVLDEFHERHLESDLALALLRHALARRSRLHLLLMSATLDLEALIKAIGPTPVLRSPGRQHPVEVRYKPHSALSLEEQVAAAVQEGLSEASGHLLIFLPGAAEIRRAMDLSAGLVRAAGASAVALHGDLSADQQDQVVSPSDQRKVIFSTNVAESSVTINGVRCVVDSGLARVSSWSRWSGFSQLRIERISRSSAIQRAGRAGRSAPGLAIRLYSEEDFRRRAEQPVPEILRADLSQLLLQLAGMDVDIEELQWLEQPPAAAVEHARDLLRSLGAIDNHGCLLPAGKQMVEIPAHPRLSRFLIEAARLGTGREAAKIAAVLSEGRVRLDELSKHSFVYDLDALLSGEYPGNVRRLEQLLLSRLPRSTNATKAVHGVERAILCGNPDRVARKRGEALLLSNGGSAKLDRASAVQSEFLCAIEVDDRAEQGTPLVRIASAVEPDWLLEQFPDRISTRETLQWNRTAERVEQVSALLYDELVIDETVQRPPNSERLTEMLVQQATQAGIQRFTDKDSLDHLLVRVRFAKRYFPGLKVSENVIERALEQMATGLSSFTELRQACANGALEQAIRAMLPMAQIDRLAPTHIRLPNGRRARIEYSDTQAPWVASRLQDFFGMRETPRVAEDAVPVVVHLLAPNRRPLQMTQDLSSFWKTLYPQIRRELSRRYPKHKWPEDPLASFTA